VVWQHLTVEGVQSKTASALRQMVLLEEIRMPVRRWFGGIQIALVPFLSYADPLKTWRASFEAQLRESRATWALLAYTAVRHGTP
jgi:hypothetical protein